MSIGCVPEVVGMGAEPRKRYSAQLGIDRVHQRDGLDIPSGGSTYFAAC